MVSGPGAQPGNTASFRGVGGSKAAADSETRVKRNEFTISNLRLSAIQLRSLAALLLAADSNG
jgi:hypothetical protein